MDTRVDTLHVLLGLGAGFLLLLAGVAGAGAALGYLAILVVLGGVALAVVGMAAGPALAPGRTVTDPATSERTGFGVGLPESPLAIPAPLLFLLGGLAALPGAGLLASAGNHPAALVLLAGWAVGLTGLAAMVRAGLGAGDFIAAGLAGVALLASLASLAAGFIIGAVCGLGYLLAVAFGYGMFRLDRAGTMPAPAGSPEAVTRDWVEAALSSVDLLRRLNDEQRAAVLRIGEVQQFPSGFVLGIESKVSHALYCILRGQVQLSVRSPMGQLTVRVAGEGESLPLAALIGDHSLVTTAVVLDDLTALTLPRAALMQLCQARPDIGMEVYAAVAEVLGSRYRASLARVTHRVEQLAQEPELWANV